MSFYFHASSIPRRLFVFVGPALDAGNIAPTVTPTAPPGVARVTGGRLGVSRPSIILKRSRFFRRPDFFLKLIFPGSGRGHCLPIP